MTAEYDGADALMAAITGEEPSDEARADAAFMAEHRKAVADVALLREQLGIIGDALGAQERPQRLSAPVRAPRDWRRARRFAFGSLAAAAVATVLAGMGWLATQAGSGASEDSGSASGAKADASARSPMSSPGYLACAGLVAEGDVTEVERVPGAAGQERITLDVTRSYKPEKAGKKVTFVVEEEAVQKARDKALHKGDHILVAIPQHGAPSDYVLVGEQSIARERAGLEQALKESAGVTCG
ncbi:hypothetical protein GCM10022403_066940 [Streptomyces coacervatus]|uniref:DUF5667 domain-containing protein n=1 Tax=Streptomyces coacervatus TaxID=647381 RepID=A0ABP7IQU0_9ACTN|nr:hypothetical protein [Streptomyces coacervatus]MDF2266879.1 hypothetical protein [Streptomyces coacervatus]